jgi:hypothetical protein
MKPLIKKGDFSPKSNYGWLSVKIATVSAIIIGLIKFLFAWCENQTKEKTKTKESRKRERDRVEAEKKLQTHITELRMKEREQQSRLKREEREHESNLKMEELERKRSFKMQCLHSMAENSMSDTSDSTPRAEIVPKSIEELEFNPRNSEIRYLLAHFFEAGTISILAGRTNCGKTYLLYHILYAIAEGFPSGLVDDELDRNEFMAEVVAFLGESSVADLRSRFPSHHSIRVIPSGDCALLETDVDRLVQSIKDIVDNKQKGHLVVALDNLKKLIGEGRDYSKFELLRPKLEGVIADAKKRDVTVSVIMVAHTDPGAKTPGVDNLGGAKSKVEMTKNIVEIFPMEKLGNEYVMLVPIKCKYDNTLSENGYIIKQYKSKDEDESGKLFERVGTMKWAKALKLKNTKELKMCFPEKADLFDSSSSDVANAQIIANVGRPKKVSDDYIFKIADDIKAGMSQSDACSKYGVARSTFLSRAKSLGL